MSRDTELSALQDYGLMVTRLISESALDPHLYFEQKIAGQFRAATTKQVVFDRLAELSSWVSEVGFDTVQVHRWDRHLATQKYPSLALWQDSEQHALARALICGERQDLQDHALVQKALSDANLGESDTRLCKQWMLE